MKILAFTDLHGRINLLDTLKKKARKCDIVICAGDLTNFEQGLRNTLTNIAAFSKKLLVIHGNHEDSVNMERACKRIDNAIFLHKQIFKTGNYVFFGYGGGGFSMEEPEFDMIAKDFKKEIKKGKKIILVTHGPPYGTLLDIIGDDHVGCINYTEFIDDNTVDLAICGHLHENQKITQNYKKKTIIINPGPEGEIIEI